MPRLIVCSRCSSHVLVDEPTCPHCTAPLGRKVGLTVAAVLMGLTVACDKKGAGPNVPEPEYGVPADTAGAEDDGGDLPDVDDPVPGPAPEGEAPEGEEAADG